MAENYDLIFGQSASSQYAWSDSDYQNGWQTVGSTPPTAEQFDALQRRSDKKAQELNNALTPLVNQNTASNRQPLTAYALKDIRYSPLLPVGWYLECSTAGATSSGDITLPTPLVENATITDGTVTWTIRTVASTADISGRADRSLSNLTDAGLAKLVGNVSKEANGYLTLENGLIIQWGRFITNTAATTVTYYPIAFPNACLALTVTPGSSASEDVTVTISSNQTIFTDRFTWAAWKANAYDTIPGNASISYIAIGY